MADTIVITKNMRSWIAHQLIAIFQSSGIEIVDKTGATDILAASNLGVRLTASNSDVGMIVGSDVGNPLDTDFTLANQIAHGTGAGQLSHSLMTALAVVQSGDTLERKAQFTRTFTNGSGGTITIRQIGLLVGLGSSANENYLVLVIKLETPIVLLDTEIATITVSLPATI